MSFQHIFAVFEAMILVPTLAGLPVSVAFSVSGVGMLTHMFMTKHKVPVYLGSLFAYINAVVIAIKAIGGSVDAVQTGLMLVGVIYVAIASVVRVIRKRWIGKLLLPIVIGPVIAVIGLGLAASAVSSTQFTRDGDPRAMIAAIVTFLIAALISTKAKGPSKIIPFLIAIFGSYVSSLYLGLVDFRAVVNAKWLSSPDFTLPFKIENFCTYNLYFGPETFAILSVALVTISGYVDDHTIFGKTCGRNFLRDPSLERTLMGDGIAITASAFLGSPADTTYRGNISVIGMTKISSAYVTDGTACIAVLLSYVEKISAFISTTPVCVLEGISILLCGVTASNGLRTSVDNKIGLERQRNPVTASAMPVIGPDGAMLPVGSFIILSGAMLSVSVGIILNLILPEAS